MEATGVKEVEMRRAGTHERSETKDTKGRREVTKGAGKGDEKGKAEQDETRDPRPQEVEEAKRPVGGAKVHEGARKGGGSRWDQLQEKQQ